MKTQLYPVFAGAIAFAMRKRIVVLLGALATVLITSSCGWLWPERVVQKHPLLSYRNDPQARPVSFTNQELDKLSSICLPKNNYFCVKTPTGDRWNGQVGKDLAGHAIFKDPVYSARAFTRILRSYWFKHNLRTTRQILARYAPASDCIGSKHYCPVNSRALYSIKDLPYGHVGGRWVQYSTQRYPGFREGGDCFVALMYCPRGFNEPVGYARSVASSVGKGIDDNLELFDDNGRINMAVALPLLRTFSRWEIGSKYKVDDELIVKGILLEGRSLPPTWIAAAKAKAAQTANLYRTSLQIQ